MNSERDPLSRLHAGLFPDPRIVAVEIDWRLGVYLCSYLHRVVPVNKPAANE